MLHAMPAAAFAAAAGLSLPFAAQRTLVRRQYLPVVAMALWLFFANVVYGVNALVWSGSYEVRIPVWCDITTKLLIAVAYGIPSCIVCIAARLRLAVVPRELPLERTPKELKDALILDLSLCVGMPIASMIIHTIVQEHRFDIVEDLGCQPEIPAVSAGTVFFWLPALVFALLALFQCCLMLRHIVGPQRLQLHEHLALFDTTLTLSTFLSLLAAVLSIGALWAALLLLTVHEALRLPPGAVDWARVDTYAWDDFPAASQRTRRFCWWVYPAAALALTVCVAGLPALARLDVWAGTCARLHRRRSSITLRELRKGSTGHVVIRKDSVVTVSYDDDHGSTTPKYFVRHSRSLKPAHDAPGPRWSIPWDSARPCDWGRRSSLSIDGGAPHEVVIRELPLSVSPLDSSAPLQTTHTPSSPIAIAPRPAQS